MSNLESRKKEIWENECVCVGGGGELYNPPPRTVTHGDVCHYYRKYTHLTIYTLKSRIITFPIRDNGPDIGAGASVF